MPVYLFVYFGVNSDNLSPCKDVEIDQIRRSTRIWKIISKLQENN